MLFACSHHSPLAYSSASRLGVPKLKGVCVPRSKSAYNRLLRGEIYCAMPSATAFSAIGADYRVCAD
jgi:hypothetical protein